MISLFKNLLDRAGVIKSELADKANSAIRVGSWMQDAITASTSRFDSSATYKAGQYAIYNGVLAEVVADTLAGQTPDSHPGKWSLKLIVDPAAVNTSNKLPIAASAVASLLEGLEASGSDVPNGTTDIFGKVRLATVQEQLNGIVPDAASTPEGVFALIDALNKGEDTLQTVTNSGAVTNKIVELGGLKFTSLNDTYEVSKWLGLVVGSDGKASAVQVSLVRLIEYIIYNLTPSQRAFLAPTINELLQQVITQNMVAQGGANVIMQNLIGEAYNRGLYFQVQESDGSVSSAATIAFLGGDRWLQFSLANGTRLDIRPDRFHLETALFDAWTVHGDFRNLSVSGPLAGKSSDSWVKARFNQEGGKWDLALAQPSDITKDIITNGDPLAFANWIKPYIGNVSTSNPFAVNVTYCYDEVEEAEELTNKLFSITPAMVGTPQLHGFNTSGVNLFPILLDANNRPDMVMDVSFPDATHFVVSYPDSSVTDYPGGKLKLEIIS